MITLDQAPFSEGLKKLFNEKKRRNPRYSLRSFARQADLSPGALSLILNKKRRISKKQADKIIEKLKIEEVVSENLFKPFVIQEKIDNLPKVKRKKINQSKFEANEVWMAFAILNLTKTEGFKLDFSWISQRLGFSENKVEEIFKKIKAQNLLKIGDDGSVVRTSNPLETTDEVRDQKISIGHQINCELARKTVDKIEIDKRDYTSITLPVNLNNLPEAKRLIRRFQDELCELLEFGETTEVYMFNMHLFPLTKLEEE